MFFIEQTLENLKVKSNPLFSFREENAKNLDLGKERRKSSVKIVEDEEYKKRGKKEEISDLEDDRNEENLKEKSRNEIPQVSETLSLRIL